MYENTPRINCRAHWENRKNALHGAIAPVYVENLHDKTFGAPERLRHEKMLKASRRGK